jgi:hypothetical protein
MRSFVSFVFITALKNNNRRERYVAYTGERKNVYQILVAKMRRKAILLI